MGAATLREVTVTGTLHAFPERVFDFLVDNRHDELWCPMVSDVEPYHAVVELAERGERTRVRHTNCVTLPSGAQQLAWWTLANVVLRVQLRNLRRELDR